MMQRQCTLLNQLVSRKIPTPYLQRNMLMKMNDRESSKKYRLLHNDERVLHLAVVSQRACARTVLPFFIQKPPTPAAQTTTEQAYLAVLAEWGGM